MKVHIGLVAATLLAAPLAFGQTTETLTVQKAIMLGLQNSQELKVSDAKLREAEARVTQAGDHFLPNISISGSYLRINKPDISMSGSSDNSSGNDSSPFSSFANLHAVAFAQLSASEPVFQGFKIRNSKIMAGYLEEAAHYDALSTQSDVMLNTLKAFYQYYELVQTEGVVDENLKESEQREKELADREAQGLADHNDVLKAGLVVSNTQLGLTDVRNARQMAEYNLVLLLGLPDSTSIAVDTTGMYALPAPPDWQQCLDEGLTQRADLKAIAYQSKASEASYKVVRGDLLPSLSLTAGYVNADIPDVLTVQNALNAGLSLRYSLTGLLFADHHMKEAQAQKEEVAARQQMLTDASKKEIRAKYLDYQKALDKIAITTRAIDQATENFGITRNKYDQGLVLLSDYLDANTTLLQAQVDYVTARGDAMIAYYELQNATGNLTP